MANAGVKKRAAFRPHERVQKVCAGGRTRQEFRDECDVNTIMRRYGRTGLLPQNRPMMNYGDFSELPDFMTAMNVVAVANEAFAALPAHVRKRFGNDPAEFVSFAQDAENIEEMRKLGLAPKAAPKAPEEGNGGVPPAVPPKGERAPKAPVEAPVEPPTQ